MREHHTRRALCLPGFLALTLFGCAHGPKPPAAPAQPSPPAAAAPAPQAGGTQPAPVIEQRALDLLKQMSQTLASAKSYTYSSRSAMEVPGKTGQYLTFFSRADVALERPDKLRARIGGDIPSFQIVYDGKQVAAYDPDKNLYATAPAPATLDDTLKMLMDQSGVYFPSSDVMVSDPYATMTQGLQSAFVVGTSAVDGLPCEHLAFMAPGIHWEIWIETGKHPLPRRLAATYTDAANFPRFQVEFADWNLKPRLAPGAFVFKPPAGAKRIEFASEKGAILKQLEGGGGAPQP
ncbi:hypothetical protein SAMN02949497_2046 [Methylomagnum ishizawai]|uniref:DUF2092 domain-containing protein n=1 Tax=Methylomagnum ishizawai TaxID=1760988 RepID=A0A1Y6D1I9_9GAMM|nr:DUF2092 domain-containing protein [Methylomagnum ishizawai]SMF94713.1 hypothetical protein SAMN02949497_2046 [Methylomagnum ishizawai]